MSAGSAGRRGVAASGATRPGASLQAPASRSDRHASDVFIQLLTVAVAQFFDFGTFAVMVQRHGPGAEANPLVADLLGELGVAGAGLAKVALVILVAAVAVLLARAPGRAHTRVRAIVLGAAIVGGIVGGLTNAITLGPI